METTKATPLRAWIASAAPAAVGAGGVDPLDDLLFLQRSTKIALLMTEEIIQSNARCPISGEHLTAARIRSLDVDVDNAVIFVSKPSGHIMGVQLTMDSSEEGDGNVKPRRVSIDEKEEEFMCIRALGQVLLAVFSGGVLGDTTSTGTAHYYGEDNTGLRVYNSDDGGQEPKEKLLRRSLMSTFAQLQDFGLPYSTCRLVSDLVHAGDTARRGEIQPEDDDHNDDATMKTTAFRSLEEVRDELRDSLRDPDRFLRDFSPCDRPRLRFGSSLYGRERELELLRMAASRVVTSSYPQNPSSATHPPRRAVAEAVFVSGHAGCGKSSLVRTTQDSLIQSGWITLSCKFDRVQRCKPYSVIASAFEQFCRSLGEEEEEEGTEASMRRRMQRASIAKSLEQTVGREGLAALSKMIANLSLIVDSESTGRLSSSIERAQYAENRLRYLFRAFFNAIRLSGRPLVLFLDDLQWSDSAALDIVRDLVTGSGCLGDSTNGMGNVSSFLLIGCYRGNEVDIDHPLSSKIRDFEMIDSGVNVSRVQLDGIAKDDLNAMISYELRLPRRLTRPLADTVNALTGGSPLFVVECLKSLENDKLLRFDLALRRWVWMQDVIDILHVKDCVAEFLVSKLLRLPDSVLEGLKVASCLGSQVNETTATILDDIVEPAGVLAALNVALEQNFIEQAGPLFMFAHDMFQEAVYELIPSEERAALHLSIGTKLNASASAANEESEEILLLATDQINRAGPKSVSDSSQRVEFARWNLRAGKESMSKSHFTLCLSYVKSGLSFLDEESWTNAYALTLELHETAALACHIQGNKDEIMEYTSEVFLHARSFEDELHTYDVLIRHLGSSGSQAEAMERGFIVLERLGFPFTIPPKPAAVMSGMRETSNLLLEVTKDVILDSPWMEDTKKLYAMKIMGSLMLYAFQLQPMLLPILACRMIKVSLDYGICKPLIDALVAMALSQINVLGDVKGAYRIGKLAISLLEEMDASELTARVYSVMYIHIAACVQPLQATCEPFLYGYREGMLAGDVEWALINRAVYARQLFYVGHNLSLLREEIEATFDQTPRLSHFSILHIAAVVHNSASTLIAGKGGPKRTLPGIVEDDDTFLQQVIKSKDENLLMNLYFFRMVASLFMKDMEHAREMADRFREHQKKRGMLILYAFFAFYDGVIAFHFARHTNDASCKERGMEAIGSMRSWTKNSGWNFENKVYLLEAECHATEGKMEEAKVAYDAAARTAREHRFLHEEALALELGGTFLLEMGERQAALERLRQAHECYVKWGAQAKADSLMQDIAKQFVSI